MRHLFLSSARRVLGAPCAIVACCTLSAAALGASSFSNSLTGITGDSTLPATQAAVATAGFSFFSTTGLNDDFTADPTVVFGPTGAVFGGLFGGDGGRNYMRTVEADYATVDFVAEITFETSDLGSQDTFFGLGSGDTALFGWPDWSTQFSSAIFTPEINDSGESLLTTMFTTNDTPIFANTAEPGLGSGVNRMRLSYDAVSRTATFAVDFNYAGGAFVADASAPTLNLTTLFSEPDLYDAADYTVWRDTLGSTTDLRANWNNTGSSQDIVDQDDYDFWKANFGLAQGGGGWPGEPSRIFFGGDDGVIFRDFSVTVAGGSAIGGVETPEPSSVCLFAAALAIGACTYRGRS